MDWSRLLTGAFVVATVAAHAQSPTPLTAGGSATKLQYESAFTDYRPFAEAGAIPWKQANSDAAQIGGHRGHGMGESTPPPAKAAPTMTTPPAAPATAPAGHAAHPR